MKFGVTLRVRYEQMPEVARAADRLGYESVWLPEHLVFPADLGGSPIPGEDHPPVPPDIPTYDVLAFSVHLADVTDRIRLGTYVYNLALRHPLVSARAVQTLDLLSEGRVSLGVGAGWIEGEYRAAGVDFATRGRRLDECIEVLRELWTRETPSYDGEFFTIPPVKFEPKPAQGRVPILVGGESGPALRRAGRLGDGWLGMGHTPESAAEKVDKLQAHAAEYGRDPAEIEVTVGASPRTGDEVAAYARAGVDRLVVSPWRRGREAVAGLETYAEQIVHEHGEVGT